jgi:hypothetical protein
MPHFSGRRPFAELHLSDQRGLYPMVTFSSFTFFENGDLVVL